MARIGPIFVGGTGRSGTSQLTLVLGQHPSIYALPDETRFIVDPGGLEDLTRALTTAYTPYHGDDALRRFDWVMREHVTGQTHTAFRGWDVPSMVGQERYWSALATLWSRLVWYAYDESVPTLPDDRASTPYAPAAYRRVIPRYFPDRDELIGILRDFVEEVFGRAAADHGKPTWCEKTPFNLLSVPFLWELFPSSTFVHVMRHPLRVVASHLHQTWAPSSIQNVVAWLLPIYRRWFELRGQLDVRPDRLVEVRLEELADDWPRQRARLFAALGLPDAETTAEFEPEPVYRRDEQLSPADRAYVVDALGWAIERLGYAPKLDL
jgi:hypothetical protein